jgi:hypothetical protein
MHTSSVPKLRGYDNYATWSNTLEIALTAKGCWKATQVLPKLRSELTEAQIKAIEAASNATTAVNSEATAADEATTAPKTVAAPTSTDPWALFDVVPGSALSLIAQDEYIYAPGNSLALLTIIETLSIEIATKCRQFKSASKLWAYLKQIYGQVPATKLISAVNAFCTTSHRNYDTAIKFADAMQTNLEEIKQIKPDITLDQLMNCVGIAQIMTQKYSDRWVTDVLKTFKDLEKTTTDDMLKTYKAFVVDEMEKGRIQDENATVMQMVSGNSSRPRSQEQKGTNPDTQAYCCPTGDRDHCADPALGVRTGHTKENCFFEMPSLRPPTWRAPRNAKLTPCPPRQPPSQNTGAQQITSSNYIVQNQEEVSSPDWRWGNIYMTNRLVPTPDGHLCFMGSSNKIRPDSLYLDSMADISIVGNIRLLSNVGPAKMRIRGVGGIEAATQKGTLEFSAYLPDGSHRRICVPEVHYIKDHVNLLGGVHIGKYGWETNQADRVIFEDVQTRTPLCRLSYELSTQWPRIDTIDFGHQLATYVPPNPTFHAYPAMSARADMETWHHRLGCLPDDAVARLAGEPATLQLTNRKAYVCDDCKAIKIRAAPHNHPINADRSGDIIICDLVPKLETGVNNAIGYMTFTDAYDKIDVVHILTDKSGRSQLIALKEFIATFQNMHEGRCFNRLHMENEHGFNKDCKTLLADLGIQYTTTETDMPEQIGQAEKHQADLNRIIATLLRKAKLPTKYWPFALLHAVWLKNRRPHPALNGKTPLEVATGKPPRLYFVRVWGSKVYYKNKTLAKSDKFTPKGKKGILMAYTGDSPQAIIFDEGDKKIHKTSSYMVIEPASQYGQPEKATIFAEGDDVDALIYNPAQPVSIPATAPPRHTKTPEEIETPEAHSETSVSPMSEHEESTTPGQERFPTESPTSQISDEYDESHHSPLTPGAGSPITASSTVGLSGPQAMAPRLDKGRLQVAPTYNLRKYPQPTPEHQKLADQSSQETLEQFKDTLGLNSANDGQPGKMPSLPESVRRTAGSPILLDALNPNSGVSYIPEAPSAASTTTRKSTRKGRGKHSARFSHEDHSKQTSRNAHLARPFIATFHKFRAKMGLMPLPVKQ